MKTSPSRSRSFPAITRRGLVALGDLVLPRECAGCARPDTALCDSCAAVLAGPGHPVCPEPVPVGLPPAFAVGGYEATLRAVLLEHKERGRLALARPLGAGLARAVLAAGGRHPVTLVPVPSTRRATYQRGHDPTGRIAVAAAGELCRSGVDAAVLAALGHRRAVSDQIGLSAAARVANVAGAMAVRPGFWATVAGRRIVVVDDVLTTGATLVEAARALRAEGAQVIAVATVAATALRGWHQSGAARQVVWGASGNFRPAHRPRHLTARSDASPCDPV